MVGNCMKLCMICGAVRVEIGLLFSTLLAVTKPRLFQSCIFTITKKKKTCSDSIRNVS